MDHLSDIPAAIIGGSDPSHEIVSDQREVGKRAEAKPTRAGGGRGPSRPFWVVVEQCLANGGHFRDVPTGLRLADQLGDLFGAGPIAHRSEVHRLEGHRLNPLMLEVFRPLAAA